MAAATLAGCVAEPPPQAGPEARSVIGFSVSPDGRHVAVTTMVAGCLRTWLLDAQGRMTHALGEYAPISSPATAGASPLAWGPRTGRPDRDWLLVERPGDPVPVLLDLATGTRRPEPSLASGPASSVLPAGWLHDGRMAIWRWPASAEPAVSVVDPVSGEETIVSAPVPAELLDDGRLWWLEDAGGRLSAVTLDLRTGERMRAILPAGVEHRQVSSDGAWSLDVHRAVAGDRVVTTLLLAGADGSRRAVLGEPELASVPLAEAAGRAVVLLAEWTPRQHWAVVTAFDAPSRTEWLVFASHGRADRLPPKPHEIEGDEPASLRRMERSPSGQRLADLARDRGGSRSRIDILDVSGAPPRWIAHHDVEAIGARWLDEEHLLIQVPIGVGVSGRCLVVPCADGGEAGAGDPIPQTSDDVAELRVLDVATGDMRPFLTREDEGGER